MSSVLTLFLNNPIQSGSSAGLLDLTQPAASTSTTGWTVGTQGSVRKWSLLSYDQKLTTSSFTGAAEPAQPPSTTAAHFAADCWRTSATTSGTFSAGTWYSSASLIAVSASGASGNMKMRIWRSSSVSAAGAVEITKAGSTNSSMLGTTVSLLQTTVAQSSSASTQVGAVTLTNEYLFLQMAWQILTSGAANANTDVLFRMGPVTDLANGSFLVTPTFTPTASGGGASGAGFYAHRKHYELVN